MVIIIEESSILRFGYISAYDPAKHAARVKFPGMGDLISGWLPVGVPNSKSNRDECALDVDEHVAVLLSGDGCEEGIILCALYDDANAPDVKDPEKRRVKFQDGTEIYYSRKDNELKISHESGSTYEMTGGDVRITNAAGCIIEMIGGNVRISNAAGCVLELVGGNISLTNEAGSSFTMAGGNLKQSNESGSYIELKDDDINMYNSKISRREAWKFDDTEWYGG